MAVVMGWAEKIDCVRAWQEMIPQIATDVEGRARDDPLGHEIALGPEGYPQRWPPIRTPWGTCLGARAVCCATSTAIPGADQPRRMGLACPDGGPPGVGHRRARPGCAASATRRQGLQATSTP